MTNPILQAGTAEEEDKSAGQARISRDNSGPKGTSQILIALSLQTN
jgi:hypothetical protein